MADKVSVEDIGELIQTIGRAQARLVAMADALHGHRGLAPSLRGVLLCIEANGPQNISRLAELCAVSRQFLQRSVQALIAGDWAETQPNPRHKGSPLIALAPRGIDEVARIHDLEAPYFRNLAARVSRDELTCTLRVLACVTV